MQLRLVRVQLVRGPTAAQGCVLSAPFSSPTIRQPGNTDAVIPNLKRAASTVRKAGPMCQWAVAGRCRAEQYARETITDTVRFIPGRTGEFRCRRSTQDQGGPRLDRRLRRESLALSRVAPPGRAGERAGCSMHRFFVLLPKFFGLESAESGKARHEQDYQYAQSSWKGSSLFGDM
jgi:hypothetical protein